MRKMCLVHLKSCVVNAKPEQIYTLPKSGQSMVRMPQYLKCLIDKIERENENCEIAWTSKMVRMAVLVSNALENKEPALLVGDTGCGKTTISQYLADAIGQNLFTGITFIHSLIQFP